jgi:hypothetical protein
MTWKRPDFGRRKRAEKPSRIQSFRAESRLRAVRRSGLSSYFLHIALLMNGVSLLIGLGGFKFYRPVAQHAYWESRLEGKMMDFGHRTASCFRCVSFHKRPTPEARRRDVLKTL